LLPDTLELVKLPTRPPTSLLPATLPDAELLTIALPYSEFPTRPPARLPLAATVTFALLAVIVLLLAVPTTPPTSEAPLTLPETCTFVTEPLCSNPTSAAAPKFPVILTLARTTLLMAASL